MVCKIFDTRTGLRMSVNKELTQIQKFKKRKDYVRFKDNIWAAYLVEMGPLSSFNCCVK